MQSNVAEPQIVQKENMHTYATKMLPAWCNGSNLQMNHSVANKRTLVLFKVVTVLGY
jgi:hypothetical protein